MFSDAQDVVGESCASQLEPESPVLMASVRASRNLPRPTGADEPASSSWRLLGAVGGGEAHGERSNYRRAKHRPSAAAMVLARKRRRDEQRRKLGAGSGSGSNKKRCVGGGATDESPSDDDYDVEEQLTAFVEYNATDMDSLDINPSQDFDGDVHGRHPHNSHDENEDFDAVTQASELLQTCGWENLTDEAQEPEEASEVFDNVIYASRPAMKSPPRKTTSFGPSNGGAASRKPLSFASTPEATAEPDNPVAGPVSDESEGSLSDGFEVTSDLKTAIGCTAWPSDTKPSDAEAPKTSQRPPWRQRRSVKRDSSFVDSSASSFELQLLPPSTSASSSSAKVLELKNGSFDSSDGELETPMQSHEATCAPPNSAPATVDTMTLVSSSSSGGGGMCPMGFQPRLVRKRRKVGQLTLDGFFSAPQSWS